MMKTGESQNPVENAVNFFFSPSDLKVTDSLYMAMASN